MRCCFYSCCACHGQSTTGARVVYVRSTHHPCFTWAVSFLRILRRDVVASCIHRVLVNSIIADACFLPNLRPYWSRPLPPPVWTSPSGWCLFPFFLGAIVVRVRALKSSRPGETGLSPTRYLRKVLPSGPHPLS